jgi:endonuclease/exonuclease/phosphatase family metal-dependent hydrolase
MDLTVSWRKKRGVLQAHCRVPIGEHTRSFVVHNLHLGLAGSERGAQLLRLMDSDMLRRLRPDTPTLIGGDLNDLWGSLGPKFLVPSGFRRAGPLSPTFPSWLPLRPLDGLFTRGDLHVERFEVCRTQLAKATSDHRPLLAEIVIDWKD